MNVQRGRRWMLAGCASLALAAAGCSATSPAPSDAVVLEGTLVLRGNEPHTQFVLLRGDGQAWELQDVAPAAGRPLQNRQVRATGVVTRAPSAGGVRLPALRVTHLRPLP